MLPITLRRTRRTPHSVIETSELAPGARIHVAHAADNNVCLVIEIKTVCDQFLEVYLGRPFTPAFAWATTTRTAAIASSAITTSVTSAVATPALCALTRSWTAATPVFARRTIFATPALFALFLLDFSHVLFLSAAL